MPRVELVPLPSRHRVGPGDDLVAMVLAAADAAGVALRDGDVVCIASKVVSKAEGAFAELPPADDVHAARRRLAEAEAVRVVADTPWVLVVETRHGFVCANAGIDTSNVPGGRALLLPTDPDATAAALAQDLGRRVGARIGVVVTDTFGRPWRLGQTDVALGAAGIEALRDERGTRDLEGRPLEVTLVAVADELAAAADLVRRKADGTPFVLVRGAEVSGDGRAADLLRDADEDVFRHGGATATARALVERRPTRTFTDTPVARPLLDAAASLAATALGSDGAPDWRLRRLTAAERPRVAAVADRPSDATAVVEAPEALAVVDGTAFAAGAAVQTFQVAARANGLGSDWIGLDARAAATALAEDAPVWGVIVVGHPDTVPAPLAPPSLSPLR